VKTLDVYVISSVLPEGTTGGQVVLHRHLVVRCGKQTDDWRIHLHGESQIGERPPGLVRRVIKRLQRTRLARYCNDLAAVETGRRLDHLLPVRTEPRGRGVVVTVAHGELWQAAVRYARAQQLPLVTFFHDWWPDIPAVHRPVRRFLDAKFRFLYRQSASALCVSNGMLEALGDHAGPEVLYPIPQRIKPPAIYKREPRSGTFCLKYSGNLFEYGPMLEEAMKAFAPASGLRLEVRGANPRWSPGFQEEMKKQGLWHEFAPRHELDAWLSEADAFLVPMSFASDMARRMQTSFPSKLTEFAQLGKPLILWGPDYCSAVRWAAESAKALCVTNKNPGALVAQVKELANSPPEWERLARAAVDAARGEFDPERLQNQFKMAIERVAVSS
jgi:glycosyltransferase involved in cell wall biosynthesis